MQVFSKRTVRKLLAELTGGSPRVRSRALSYLRTLGPDSISVLHAAVDRHGQTWFARLVSTPIALGCLVLFAFGALAGLRWPNWDDPQCILLGTVIVATVTVVAAHYLSALRFPEPGYQPILATIAEIGDIRSIEYLVAGLKRADKTTYPVVSAAVSAILADVTPSDAAKIPNRTRVRLWNTLAANDSYLVMSVLRAIPVFEDAGPLHTVGRLASGELLAASDKQVRKLAQEILPAIREISQRTTGHNSLLRAYDPAASIAETALRPVEHTLVLDSGEMLRAASEAHEDEGEAPIRPGDGR